MCPESLSLLAQKPPKAKVLVTSSRLVSFRSALGGCSRYTPTGQNAGSAVGHSLNFVLSPPGGFEHYMFSTGPRVVLAALRATCSSFLILPAMLRVAWVSFRSAQVPPGGFEPPTVSLRASCSTN